MAFIDDLNTIETEKDGERMIVVIVKCISFLQATYYPDLDISEELSIIQSNPAGNKVRMAIHGALLKMSKVDDTLVPGITELTQAEYDAITSRDDILYGISDPTKVYVAAVNPETGEPLSETLTFDTLDDAIEYVRYNVDDDKFYGMKGSSLVTGITTREFVTLGGLVEYCTGGNETTIGERAFAGCEDLTHVEFSNALLTIGEKAFEGCIGLTSLTVPSSVQTIASNAFISTSITKLVVNAPEGAIEGAPWGAEDAVVYWMGGQ